MIDIDLSSIDNRISDSLILRIWSSVAIIGVLSVGVLSFLFPKQFYDQFIWKYFWGPIVADAHGAAQVERFGGETFIPSAGLNDSVVAEPGYTVVSTAAYGIILVFALIGARVIFQRLEYDFKKETVLSFIPFMIFGGLIRVAEDLNVFIYTSTDSFFIPFPYSSLIISPIIYFVLFAVGILILVSSDKLSSRIDRATTEELIATVGTLMSVTLLLGFLYSTFLYDDVSLNILVLLVVLALTTVTSTALYFVLKRFTGLCEGSGLTSLGLIFAHSFDGFANVVSLDWLGKLGVEAQYNTKHVVNEGVRVLTRNIQPEWLSDLIGVTWPFMIIKIGIVVFLLWVLNEEFFEESPRTAFLTLIVAIAVGLGPATRDIVRVTLGI